MARGDVVSGIATVATEASLVFQPPAGTEVMITGIGSSGWVGTTPNRTPDVDVDLTDGVLSSEFRKHSQATLWSGETTKLFITNSIFLRMINRFGTSADLAYTGIQTK